MSSQLTRIVSPGFALAAAMLALAACNRDAAQGTEPAAQNAELNWARAALERNPQLEVIATDPLSGVLTVKHRSTGEIQAVKLSDIAAAPVSQLKPMDVQPASAPEPQPAATEQESATAGSQQQATAPAGSDNQQVAAAPGGSQSQTSGNYTIERTGGQIRVSGPGVSIVSSGSGTAAGNRDGTRQRSVDPFICEGRRMLQLDGRDIYVDGDAITARGGCELHITNSRIVASGTGIVVRDATVHVSNSHIEGANGSFEADDRARMFVRGSTFLGVPRRAEMAMVQDQGGNRWR
jgi:hypothetical protein